MSFVVVTPDAASDSQSSSHSTVTPTSALPSSPPSAVPPTTTLPADPTLTYLSIIRALDEVQVLDKRIEKKTLEAVFTAMLSKKNRQTLLPEQFGHAAKADWQAINDLIFRRNAIKSAILASNSVTYVTVAGERLTIAEVIERKKSIALQTSLLAKLKTQRADVLRSIEANNVSMDSELQKLLEIHFGKKDHGNRSQSSDVEEITKSFREQNSAKLLDPIGIDSKIKELESYIEQFEREIKFILSESNAITKIAIKNQTAGEKKRTAQAAQQSAVGL